MGRRIPSSLVPVLTALRQRLALRYGPRLREVRLFGSFARAEANEDSDVDVLVVIDGLTDAEIGDVVAAALEVQLQTGFLLSALPLSSEGFEHMRRAGEPLARDLDAEGIPL